MKIKVYGEEEPVVRLALSRWGDGSVVLSAVDANGEALPCGHLLTILPDGYIKRSVHINPELGFPLDLMGRLVFAEDKPE